MVIYMKLKIFRHPTGFPRSHHIHGGGGGGGGGHVNLLFVSRGVCEE